MIVEFGFTFADSTNVFRKLLQKVLQNVFQYFSYSLFPTIL